MSLELANSEQKAAADPIPVPQGPQDIPMLSEGPKKIRISTGFWTLYYKIIFRIKGIVFGKGLKVTGPLILRVDGNAKNIQIGNNVTLMPWVDLKVRENGKIILHDDVFLDTLVRLVSANDARIELGDGVRVGLGSYMTAGTDILLGRETSVAGYCAFISSEHIAKKNLSILKQAYTYEPIYIGEGVWISGNALINKGSRIGSFATIGAKAVVNGDIQANGIALGMPARVIKFRE